MIGHDRLRRSFITLVDTGRLRQTYLFFGPDGVGKRTFAEGLANYCETKQFEPPAHTPTDRLIIAASPNSIGIDEVRRAKNFLGESAFVSSRKTVIIDDADMLTTQAQNAILKIAEEPPPHTLLILIVKDPETLLPTITSRFQKIYFGPLKNSEMVDWLKILDPKISKTDQEKVVHEAKGSPGYARQIESDEFKLQRKTIKAIFDASGRARQGYIKDYLEAEGDPLKLIDTAILLIGTATTRKTEFLKRALAAKSNLSTLNLNPRLQLENLFSHYD